MNRVLIAVLFLLVSSVSLALAADGAAERYGEEYQACREGNTHDIVVCLSALYRKWDERLNAAYQKLLKQQEDAKNREALVRAQRAWLKYRDDNCEWYETGEGTIRRLWGSECMRSMTAARALELETAAETH